MNNRTKSVMKLFYVLIAIFIVIIISISPIGMSMSSLYRTFLSDEIAGWINFFSFFALGGVFTILGFVLVVLAKKRVENKYLKKFLILTGLSAGFFLILSVLHNVFYAIAETFADNVLIKSIMSVLEVISFMVAICVIPIVFLVGTVCSIVLYRKISKKSTP
jgi:phosphoglycerol transferase MdoB-like AlkP superfamily enzyme